MLKLLSAIAFILFAGSILYLDKSSQPFRDLFAPQPSDPAHVRAANHNHLIDNNNLYEQGLLSPQHLQFGAKQDHSRFQKLKFGFKKIVKQYLYVKQQHPEYDDFPHIEDIFVFIINGNQGSHEQPPLVANQMEKYLNQLTESQKTAKKDARFRDDEHRTFYRLNAYEWDFHRQPSAFSEAMFKDQAKMIKESIKRVMAESEEKRFSIIAHSIGCHIGYYIQDEIDENNENLQNIICMGTPFGQSPTQVNKGMEKIQAEIKQKQWKNKYNNYNFIFNSGEKDFHINSEVPGEDRFEKHLNQEKTLVINIDRDLKHFYSSLNHASYWYSKYWQDTFSVFAAKMMISKDRLKVAREHLLLLHDEPIDSSQTQPVIGQPDCDQSIHAFQEEYSISPSHPQLSLMLEDENDLHYQFFNMPKTKKLNIYIKNNENKEWSQIKYNQYKYHSFFPNGMMSFTVGNARRICFGFVDVSEEDIWVEHQDLRKNTSAWQVHYKKDHKEEQFEQEPTSSTMQLVISKDIPQEPFQNKNLFKYVILTKLRHDVWQILYSSIFTFIVFQLLEILEARNYHVSLSIVLLLQFNLLALYANENIGFILESGLLWWQQDLASGDLPWLLFKFGLNTSLGYVLYRVSKMEFPLQKVPIAHKISMALFRLVAVSLLGFNLYLGCHGGTWWTASLKDLESEIQKQNLTASDVVMHYTDRSGARATVGQLITENAAFFSKSCGEKYVFIDLIAFLLLIITQKKKCLANSRILGCLVLFHLIINLDRFIAEVWKITNDSYYYQTLRTNDFFELEMLNQLDFSKRWRYLAFLQENVITLNIWFFFFSLNTQKCENPQCELAAAFKCPSCLNLALPCGNFCTQECLKKTWAIHQLWHKKAGGTTFKYAGALRPYPYSFVEMRKVPAEIQGPDYAETGAPGLIASVAGQSTIPIHTTAEIQTIRRACKIGREALDAGHRAAKPGATTEEVDRAVHDYIISRGAYPSPLNYHKFPRSCCTSINEVICHGIPDTRPLQDGDIVNLDVSCYKDGFHADLNETYCVGQVDDAGVALVDTTYQSLMKAIEICRPGAMYREIGNVITKVAEPKGYGIVRNYQGHGVGRLFHQAPAVPHYAGNKAVGFMKPGHVFTIEPMINEGTHKDVVWQDAWTATTSDGRRSAQFEHTILITEKGHEILTARSSSSPALEFQTLQRKKAR